MISRRERWSYAAGDLGFNFVWQSIELYLLFYYIRVLGLTPAFASIIFLAGAAADWIADPLVGVLADRSRWPLRVWVVFGGPLAVLMLAIVFAPLPVGPEFIPAAALTAYVALRFAYSLGNVPYAALTARISPAPADHLALTGSRMQGAAIGGLVAALVYAMLPAASAGDNFRLGALLLALLAMPAFLATYMGVRERVTYAPASGERASTSLLATLTMIGRSPTLRRLLATILAAGLAVTVINKSLLFLFDAIGEQRLGFYVALAPAAALLLTAPLWTIVGTRFGRRRALLLAGLLQVSALVLATLVAGVAALTVFICLAIIAGCGLSIMFWSLVPAAVADCEADATQAGCAGRVYALSNIARKLAQALAPQVIALSLAGGGASLLQALCVAAVAALAVILLYGPRSAGPASSGSSSIPSTVP